MSLEIIRNTDTLNDPSVETVGGKGLGLIKLTRLSKGRGFEVPEFYIIPVRYDYSEHNLQQLYELLPGPLAVRSSSPYEDSKGYSFAGLFESKLNVHDYDSFKEAINDVLASADYPSVQIYAQQHGLTIDNKMAVIVQKMVDPFYSGVCYSTVNPDNPKTIIEYEVEVSSQLMSGDEVGIIVSFDKDFTQNVEYGFHQESIDLRNVAQIARDLESICNEKLDIEFAVSRDEKLYIVQARPVTDPAWEQIQLPTIDKSRVLSEADIVRGSGNFTGPAFVFRSPTQMRRYSEMQNRDFWEESFEQLKKLAEFDRKNPTGYCLITDTLEYHKQILDMSLSNLKTLVTVNYASRFSHPIKIVSEMKVFYLGIMGRKDLLDVIETGDRISVVSDQSRGIVYDLIKKPIELRKTDLEKVEIVQYKDTINNTFPNYEDVDDKLFLDEDGKVGVLFWDYNEEGGIPTDVFYILILMDQGYVIDDGEYNASKARSPYLTFLSLLDDLWAEAKIKSAKLINQLPK